MISIRACTLEDAYVLQKISRHTYKDTFASMNTEANMKAYLEEAYDLDKLKQELSNEESFFYFIYQDDKLSGYSKLNEGNAQTDIYDPISLEVERIYVLKDCQGKGIGRYLMNKAVEIASQRNKFYMWLGVWEKNKKALEFYKRSGFYRIGTHPFIMGDEVQNDYILRKDLDK